MYIACESNKILKIHVSRKSIISLFPNEKKGLKKVEKFVFFGKDHSKQNVSSMITVC